MLISLILLLTIVVKTRKKLPWLFPKKLKNFIDSWEVRIKSHIIHLHLKKVERMMEDNNYYKTKDYVKEMLSKRKFLSPDHERKVFWLIATRFRPGLIRDSVDERLFNIPNTEPNIPVAKKIEQKVKLKAA